MVWGLIQLAAPPFSISSAVIFFCVDLHRYFIYFTPARGAEVFSLSVESILLTAKLSLQQLLLCVSLFTFGFCLFFVCFCVFHEVEDGIYLLGRAHVHSAPSLKFPQHLKWFQVWSDWPCPLKRKFVEI